MVSGRLAKCRRRISAELQSAFLEGHPPHDVAASFAVGVFVTTLPTLGAGLLLFAAIAHLSNRVSGVALFASVLVLNPAVKWGVYGTSFWLGTRLLGPVSGAVTPGALLSAGPDLAIRLLVGNVLLATVFTVAGYAIVFRLVTAFQRRPLQIVDGPGAT